MTFEEWFDSLPEDELKTYGMGDAYNGGFNIGVEAAARLVAEKYDEQEPWITPEEVLELKVKI